MNNRNIFGKSSHFMRMGRILVSPFAAVLVTILLLTSVQPVESDETTPTEIKLLIADFTYNSNISGLADLLKPVLHATLQQSGSLTIYPETKIRKFLNQNSGEARDLQPRNLALQICLEEDIPTALLPGIEILNGSLVISARILHVNENRESFVDTIRVNNIEHLATTVEELGRRIRHSLGESRESPTMTGNVFPRNTSLSILKLFSQSLSLYASRSRQDVMDGLKEILEENPDMALAQLHLGMHYLQLQQHTKALPHVIKAQSLSGDLPLKYRYLIDGIYNSMLHRHVKADDYFQSYTETFPSDWQAHFQLAQCAAVLGNYPLSIEEYLKAIELDDTQLEPYLDLCMAHLFNLDPLEARKVLDQASRIDSYNRDLMEARRILDRDSMLDSNNPEISILLGLLELINNNPRFAIQAFEKARQFPLYRSRATFLQAQAKIYGGNFKDALKILASGIEKDKENRDFAAEASKRLARAQIYLVLGNFQAAADESREITVIEKNPVFMAKLGSVQARSGEINSANTILRQLRSLQSDPFVQALIHQLQGEILLADDRLQESIQSFLQSQKSIHAPSIPLANALMNSEQWKPAEAEFIAIRENKAAMLFPFHMPWFMGSWVQALYDAGQCSLQSGSTTDAKQNFRQYLWVMESADPSLNTLKKAEVLLTGNPIRSSGQND